MIKNSSGAGITIGKGASIRIERGPDQDVIFYKGGKREESPAAEYTVHFGEEASATVYETNGGDIIVRSPKRDALVAKTDLEKALVASRSDERELVTKGFSKSKGHQATALFKPKGAKRNRILNKMVISKPKGVLTSGVRLAEHVVDMFGFIAVGPKQSDPEAELAQRLEELRRRRKAIREAAFAVGLSKSGESKKVGSD